MSVVVEYPSKEVQTQIPADIWTGALKSWANVVQLWLEQRDEGILNDIVGFANSYVREEAKNCGSPSTNDADIILRNAVFQTFLETADQTRSPEVIWDFVRVYGSSNVSRVCGFLAHASNSVDSLGTKLSRLILFYLNLSENTVKLDHQIVSSLSVILKVAALRSHILGENWFKQLHKYNSSLASQLSRVSERALGLPDYQRVKSVLDIFPQLSYSRAERLLLRYGEPESLISAIFDDSSLLEEKEKRKDKKQNSKVKSKTSAGSRSSYQDDYKISVLSKKPDGLEKDDKTIQTTLRLIYQADEDDHDDSYDDAEALSKEPASSSLVNKIEQYLWDLYQKSPAHFKRDSRKSKIRSEMKKKTEWSDEQIEGWAKIIEISPRRRHILEEKYMFRGNKPERGFFAHFKQQLGDNEVESSGVESGVTSGVESGPNDTEDEQRLSGPSRSTNPSGPSQSATASNKSGPFEPPKRNQRHKTANKVRQANHNRKAGHAKKMNEGMAGLQ